MGQIWLNLALNAQDAVSGTGRISVTLAMDEGLARLLVTDTGAGVAPEIQGRLSVAFTTTKPETGTGLGLATARRLARKGVGEVSVGSVPGQGSRFTVELRLVRQVI